MTKSLRSTQTSIFAVVATFSFLVKFFVFSRYGPTLLNHYVSQSAQTGEEDIAASFLIESAPAARRSEWADSL